MGQKQARKGLLSEGEQDMIFSLSDIKNLREQREGLKEKKQKTANDKKRFEELQKKIKNVSDRYKKLSEDLQERIEAVHDDLTIIMKSKKLVTDLRLLGLSSFLPFLVKFDRLTKLHFEEIESKDEFFADFSKWKVYEIIGENGRKKYWLSTTEKGKPTFRDTSTPYYSIIGIHSSWTIKKRILKKDGHVQIQKIDVRTILYEALDLMQRYPKLTRDYWILPINEVDSIEIRDIQERIKKFKKKLKINSGPTITVYKKKKAQKLLEDLQQDGIKLMNFQKKPKKKISKKELEQLVQQDRTEYERKKKKQELYGQKNYEKSKI